MLGSSSGIIVRFRSQGEVTQRHHPGRLSASDFTHMSELGITIQGQSFPHLIYHLVLTYSNWESATGKCRNGTEPTGYRRR